MLNFQYPARVLPCAYNETGLFKVVLDIPRAAMEIPRHLAAPEMVIARTGDRPTAEIICAALTHARLTFPPGSIPE